MKDNQPKKRPSSPGGIKQKKGRKTVKENERSFVKQSKVSAHRKRRPVSSKKSVASVEKKQRKLTPLKTNKPRGNRSKRVKRSRRLIGELLLSLFLTSGLIYVISLFTFTFYKVDSYMMTPEVTVGDTVFINKLASIQRFDLVLFRTPSNGQLSIRRVIGLPNDRLYYQKDRLYLNEQEQVERFLEPTLKKVHQDDQLVTEDFHLNQIIGQEFVPADSYFVMGDNRQFAVDSRTYGVVDKKLIIGVVQMRIFPLYKMTDL